MITAGVDVMDAVRKRHPGDQLELDVGSFVPTLSDPMDCSPPGSSVHGILQARVLH